MRYRLITFAVTVVALLATGAAAGSAQAARTVRGGTIELGRGAGGVHLGMTRADVVRTLGRPFYANRNGYMQYMPDGADGLFDVYATGNGPRATVRMIGIASRGRAFKLTDGTAIFTPGALRAVKRRFGRALRLIRTADGERVFRLTRRHGGLRTITDFTTTRPDLDARVVQLFIVKLS